MESLKLTIPSQQEGQHILVETNKDKLENWLRSLPFADIARTLPEVTRAIASLNRAEISYKKRTVLVDLFDSTYQLIHDYFRPKRAANSKIGAFEKDNLEKLHNFSREMAFAHKIIVNDCQHKRQLWGQNKIKIKSMAFSIYYLGLMLVETYENYTPIPIYLWREINTLYAHAGKENILNDPISTAAKSYCLPTIEQNYIRNCLIALADPYHLDKGEHWHVFHYLQNWIHLARISEDPDDFRNDECFIIDVTSEDKPNFVTSELDDPEDPKIRLLLTVDLLKQIKFDSENFEQTNKLPDNSFHPSITFVAAKALWSHLQAHWRHRIDRNSRRYPIVNKVDFVWGLNPVCGILSAIAKTGRKDLDIDIIKTLSGVDDIQHLTWDATNVSSGGIGLYSRHYLVAKHSVGNIAIIREYMDRKPSPHWRLAICRWLTGDSRNGTMLGLEYIDGKYAPVRLVLHQGKNEKGGQAGIVVTDAEVNNSKSATIITSKGSSQGDRSYAMLGLDVPIEVKPRSKVEITPCIERFFFQTYKLNEQIASEVHDQNEEIVPWTAIPHELGNINDEFETSGEEVAKTLTLDDLRLPGDH